MVKKAIALGLFMAVTSVASAQVTKDDYPTNRFTQSGLVFNFEENLNKEPALVGKVTHANQDIDEDSDGEGIKAPSRISTFMISAKEKVSSFFSWIASKFGF